jgi:shikimate kinase
LSPPAPRPRDLILLIGYRGTGKSTLAPLVAARLGWRAVDADLELERRAGASIRALIEREGEAGFRDREAALLEELCALSQHVVATGGGVVLREANRERLRQAGRVIWLTATADEICARLESDPTTPARRPALGVGGRTEVEEALRAREPLYRACAEGVAATDGPPERVVDVILAWLGLARQEVRP